VPIKNRQQMLVIVASTVIALFAGDRLVLSPLTTAWKTRAVRIAKLRKQVDDGERLRQREKVLRSRWEEMSRRTLTNDTSAAEQQVFNTIDRCAQNSGVIITAITPQSNQSKHDTDEYTTYECRADVTGDLSRLCRFLYSVEREPMALKLELVEFGARDKEGQQLSLGLQLSGLILNSSAR
jgi:hypothetical protein